MTQNARGLPERSLDADGSAKVLDDTYDYDLNGNVAAITDGATGQHGNRTMTYDGLDRLTDVDSPMYGSTGTSYAYDVLDNLTHLVAPGRDHWYCYTGNQLTNVKTGGCGGTSEIGLGYDPQGNLENKNGTLYAFDYGNRLRQAGPESYRYDAYGRRTRSSSSAGLLYTLYDQHGQLRWIRDERRGERRQYIYLQGSLLAEHTRAIGGSTHTLTYQHTDALGTPVAKTNASRTVVERSEYEPYGKLLNHPLEDGPGYTGHVSDAATGLSYMQQRYYDPGIGTFLSVDPVTVSSAGGNFNRYWYANDNPYRLTDPDGRKPLSPEVQRMRATSDSFSGILDCCRFSGHHSKLIASTRPS